MEDLPNIISIEPRFCGPEDSGNGGYVCGRLAGFIPGPTEVRLQAPPPLNTPMEVIRREDGAIDLQIGEKTYAQAKATRLDLEVPPPPSFEEAEQAAKHYLGLKDHLYPSCFVCGPQRKAGDGLCIHPGWIPEKNLVASPWIPDISLSDNKGLVGPEFMWAACDCPGAFAMMKDHFPPILLGTLSAELLQTVAVAEKCVSIGWPISQEGRKHFVGTAVFNSQGKLAARALGIWVELSKPLK